MQSMPLLLRQSIRSTTPLSRSSYPLRSSRPHALLPPPQLPGRTRPFSACLQCQFQTQSTTQSSSPNDNDKLTHDEKVAAAAAAAAAAATQAQQSHSQSTAAFLEESLRTQTADAGGAIPMPSPQSASGAGAAGNSQPGQGQVKTEHSTAGAAKEQKTQSHGGLPSYLEDRRSQFSKQFTTMMDNLQSNVFVAGQRLNDLTGYSEIEALKKEIHIQEDRLRNARTQVRTAKEAYASAINSRSASQREVNELLQRKHAWSPVDLERFTHLYRNDHTNEVAENEAQEALTAAERESEEAAAQLSKSILSRYHEEQVWSDKIRRMSTWGTWGLMGMNVLLFLIFQIGVEPWRRRRLVKGFEDKVIEAIEKEKSIGMDSSQSVAAVEATTATSAAAAAPATTVAAAPATLEEDTAADRSVLVADSATAAATPEESAPVAKDPVYESYRSQIPTLPATVSIDAWRQYFHDLFSDRGMTITQRDLSSVALQSAAAGAAIMGLVIAVIRPR